jgi:hypothetical protein
MAVGIFHRDRFRVTMDFREDLQLVVGVSGLVESPGGAASLYVHNLGERPLCRQSGVSDLQFAYF